jgi:copper transport protein
VGRPRAVFVSVPRIAVSFAAVLLASAVLASSAFAHAELLSSKPRNGQTLERPPARVLLTFDEGIDTEFVQLRVKDAAGRSASRGEPFHPAGREELVAIRLRPELEGAYVARYRVISEDGHPVEKRTRFRVRAMREKEVPAGGGEARMPPPSTGSGEDHALAETGQVTETAFAVARGAGYLAIALVIGATVFMVVVWIPALARHAGAGSEWRAASRRFAARMRGLVLGAVLLGLVATGAAIVLDAATVAGVSFWAALDPEVIESVWDTRPVRAWGVRFVLWLALGVVLVLALRPGRAPVLRRAALGAEGQALGPVPSRPQLLLLMVMLVGLALTAALGGHSATHSPEALLIPVDATHVIAMSVWFGGLAILLVAMHLCTRALPSGERTPMLATVVGRFSRMATIVVALLVATGITQAIVLVGAVDALFETGYGRLVLAKVAVLLLLLSLGAYNQRRSLPRLRRLSAGAAEPGPAAATLRRAVAAEVGLILLVLAFTSVLVATDPPAS